MNIDAGIFDRVEWALDRQSIDFEAKTLQNVDFTSVWPNSIPAHRISSRNLDQESSQFKIDFSKQIVSDNVTHNLFYGASVRRKEVENKQTRIQTPVGGEPVYSLRNGMIPSSEINNFNLFILDKINVGDDTQISLGLRYDNYEYQASNNQYYSSALGQNSLNGQDFNFFSGALSASQQLNKNFKMTAKIGRAFRAPTIENLYTRSGTEDNWRVGPNPNLDVETATNFEVSFEGRFDAGKFTVTPFFNKYQDFIESQSLTRLNSLGENDDYTIPANIGEADIKGLEFSTSINLHKALGAAKGLSTYISAAYTEGEQSNGDPLTSIQPFSAQTNLNYRAEDNSWGMTTRVRYTAAKDASDAYSTGRDGTRQEREFLSNSAVVVDISAFYNITKQLVVRASVNNLGDKEYYTWDGIRFIGRDDLRPGIGVRNNGISRFTEPGRNFVLRADYSF
jgi:hemoglobin/transferrin/lactoferrin receptor protein